MQNEYSCIFCIVDYHAITVKQDPQELNSNIINIAKHYLSGGINPEKAVIFQQSDISEHTELAWVLNNVARIADLNKMTQFKEKAGKDHQTVSVGLYDYPVLMAADILLYQTDLVPVGDDQVQHVELTRSLARRFNSLFGNVFKIPEVKTSKAGARIMGLDNPKNKMAKSSPSAANYISLTDSFEVASRKIMRAVTDSGKGIEFDRKNKPAISNLLNIYSLLSGQETKELEKKFENKGYGDFKKELALVVSQFLADYQSKFNSFSDEEIKEILVQGADKIKPIATKTMSQVKRQIGLVI